jgi:hypothetical protein
MNETILEKLNRLSDSSLYGDVLAEAADEISRLHRRNAELTASELELAMALRLSESHRQMVRELNKQQATQIEALRETLEGMK